MHLSSRWCVTAILALGALACSDPVPPPAQAAFTAELRSASPPPAGKSCRASTTFDVPVIDPLMQERLNELKRTPRVIDGERGARVRCSVKASGAGFTFSAGISLGARAIEISQGVLGADMKGTAKISVVNGEQLSTGLASDPGACTIDAFPAPNTSLQAKPGAMWASYNCEQVNAEPSDSCKVDGVFVVENCEQ